MKLLLLHGALGSKTQLKPVEEKLKNSFEVFTLNFSGHGGGKLPDKPFSIGMFAEDILRWLDKNNISRVNIFGYSMGGYAGLYFAKRQPERVGKIFTLGTKFEWTEESARREVKMLDDAKIQEKAPKFAEELKTRHKPQDWKAVLAKTREMMTMLGAKNELTIEDTGVIENEVLIGIGDRDKMVTLEESITVYRALKNGRLLVMHDTHHPIDQVDAVRLAAEIKRFFLHSHSGTQE